ncbi:hypothetical protein [Pilimelia columellifera]|uniref:Uncharacterized protein n=1 Tax=Pilimelia columellifera subsp. columellifera TaxID=706583 RepID=A0ABP6B205_9ACTN
MTAAGTEGEPTPEHCPAYHPSPAGQWASPSPPPPPPGPGVAPPFPAPPGEGGSARLGLGLGIAGAALLLCCGAGLAACVGLTVTGASAINEQGRAAVGDYLGSLRDGEYEDAYEAQCESERDRETAAEFARRQAAESRIRRYEVEDIDITGELAAPVEVTYVDGRSETLRFRLEQDGETGKLRVCGVDR